ncbi:predicted protein [Naegleria gruberi]|uniref:Predicted protein n=1 Tax=Naegleria gruberi TaxID=5762 RepID=D2VMK8_NAEGR|nr:uncharacterized protein NAEGRDRAFT_80551 [Naegleria gruberi]EFC42003.1 predicted protein [Naegleria gruberi]|eukprot:XP_002674747.1 predicted protein [Naegleria gruberi strain NEG-M]
MTLNHTTTSSSSHVLPTETTTVRFSLLNSNSKKFNLVDSNIYKKKPNGCGCALCSFFMNDFPESLNAEDYEPSRVEQVANIVTHGIPLIILSYIFYLTSHVVNTKLEMISSVLYCSSLFILLSISTLYHVMCLIHGKQSSKTYWFRIIDYATIYIFIAASYTPYLLVVGIGHENFYGKLMAAFIWLLAICGLVKSFSEGRLLAFINNNALFNLMGWAALLAMPTSMFIHVPLEAFLTLLFGGIFFSGGVYFLKKDGVIPFAHAIWHILSVCGFLMHFFSIYYYIFQLDGLFVPHGVYNSKMAYEQIIETLTGQRMPFGHLRVSPIH